MIPVLSSSGRTEGPRVEAEAEALMIAEALEVSQRDLGGPLDALIR